MAQVSQATFREIEESLACPVCEETPPGEIYMCQTGHSICRQCFDKLRTKVCPTCRGRYWNPKPRNFSLENAVAKLPIPCPLHCQEKIPRKDLTEHQKICVRRGKLVHLCKLLQLVGRCWVQMNTADASTTVQHFRQFHFATFEENLLGNIYTAPNIFLGGGKNQCHLNIFKAPPEFFQDDGKVQSYFMVCIFPQPGYVSWACLYLGNSTCGASSKYEMLLSFPNSKVAHQSFKIPIEDVHEMISNPPRMQFSRNWITHAGCLEPFGYETDLLYKMDIIRK